MQGVYVLRWRLELSTGSVVGKHRQTEKEKSVNECMNELPFANAVMGGPMARWGTVFGSVMPREASCRV